MRATRSSFAGFNKNAKLGLRSPYSVACSIMLIFAFWGAALRGQETATAPLGIAWQVKGSWRVADRGTRVFTGDAISPGSLLHPERGAEGNSIVILIPDGRRILYECFLPEDCEHSFRVPSLYRAPDPFAVDMLARIRAVLNRRDPHSLSGGRPQHRLPRDETLVILDTENRVQVEGLVTSLPNGSYTYDLSSLDHPHPLQSHLKFEKSSSSITLALPGSGLYSLTIFDHLNTPRIDFLIAAAEPARGANLAKLYRHAKALMAEWNGDYQGWPIHDFQRAFLESLILDVSPKADGTHAMVAVKTQQNDVTTEPTFSPRPGVFKGDTAVMLRCNMPGSVMHFTVDGSQPLSGSPVYSAPIMVKGTELTIKAFASAPHKKDSPVVTGIFRIGD